MRSITYVVLYISFLIVFSPQNVSAERISIPYLAKNKFMAQKTDYTQGHILNSGDPGWIRKMAWRRDMRIQAGKDATKLAALQVDKFNLPVLLGSYSDMPGSLSVRDFQDHLFSDTTGNTMTRYFDEVSYGQFRITGKVFGWYRADKPVADYLPSSYAAFCVDILRKADSEIDFSFYDNDGSDGISNSGDDDGFVDVVMVVFAGVGREWGNDGNLNSAQAEFGPAYDTDDVAFNGGFLKINRCVLVSEMEEWEDAVSISSIGVACHEFGHVLGLPDLYDGSNGTNGLGKWCLMSGSVGSHPSAWCKVMMGWVSPIIIEKPTSILLKPVESYPDVYMIWEDGYRLNRYFLLEHREKDLGFDTGIPGSGIMIYHVNENLWQGRAHSKNAIQSLPNRLIELEEADGRNDLDKKSNPGDPGDPFPGTTGNNTFDDFSNPSSRDYKGNPTGVSIANIQYDPGLPGAAADVSPRNPLGYSIVYDQMGVAGGWVNSKYWGGVLFKADTAGYLVAVDIGSPVGNYEFKVKIYQTINDTLPIGFIHSVIGHVELPGYYTVDVEEKRIWLNTDQEIFVVYNTDHGIWLDDLSQFTGRSYASDNGLGYGNLVGDKWGNVNINIRARIRTVNPILCDFNADGAVDNADIISLLIFLRGNPGDPAADFNRDGRANVLDALAMLLAQRSGRCEDPVNQ